MGKRDPEWGRVFSNGRAYLLAVQSTLSVPAPNPHGHPYRLGVRKVYLTVIALSVHLLILRNTIASPLSH